MDFSTPFHWQQILGWFLSILNILSFYIFTINLQANNPKLFSAITFGISIIMSIIIAFRAAHIDPSDPL